MSNLTCDNVCVWDRANCRKYVRGTDAKKNPKNKIYLLQVKYSCCYWWQLSVRLVAMSSRIVYGVVFAIDFRQTLKYQKIFTIVHTMVHLYRSKKTSPRMFYSNFARTSSKTVGLLPFGWKWTIYWLPPLFHSKASDLVCCDDANVRVMANSLEAASSIFERCQTCMSNFRKSICAMNCSPKQSSFLKPYHGKIIAEDDDGKWRVRFYM